MAKRTKPLTPPHPTVAQDVNKYKIPYPLAEVIWDDAASNSESWVSIKDIQPPEQVITIGWVVKDVPSEPGQRGYVTIASSLSNEELEEDVVGNTMTIPRGMIVSMRIVRAATLPPKKVKKKKSKGVVKPPPVSNDA